MDFALEASGVLLTGNIDPIAIQAMAGGLGAIFGGLAFLWGIIYLAIIVFMIISLRKVFEKAGKPGRGVFIPFYNQYLMLKIAGRPGGRLRRILIPPVFAIIMIVTLFDIAERFGKHRAFGLGLRFIPIVFFPILAFDKSIKYTPKK
ncbi:MAG: DUF5684 domain-containing protein [Candidatus Absconditicoccaceae bacterium]